MELEGFGQVQMKTMALALSSLINSIMLKQNISFLFFHKGSLPLTLLTYPETAAVSLATAV